MPPIETGFAIAGRAIGDGEPPYLIAEIGINHGGDADTARDLVVAAAEVGADAVKLQTYRTDRFLARSSPYRHILAEAELSSDAVRMLNAEAQARNIALFSSVFDEESADMMEALDSPAYKIASGDLTHLPLLRHVAGFGKPMIVSTGGANTDEIAAALECIRASRVDTPVALLHCVSNYPTKVEQLNLACLETMRRKFEVPIGFSDHTLGETAAIAAAALGAQIIEKHFTLDRSAKGPDHALSADPEGLRALAQGIRTAYMAIGNAEKAPVEDLDFVKQIRRGLTAHRAIEAGDRIERDMVAVKRPGTGIQPGEIDRVIGRRAKQAIAADEPLTWDAIE